MELRDDALLPQTKTDRQAKTARRGRGHQPHEVPLGMVIDRSSRVFFSNVPLEAIDTHGNEALRDDFAAFGPIDRYVLFSDRSGRMTGSGLCTFRNPADAKMAVYALNGRQNSDGSRLSASIAKDHGVVLMQQVEREREATGKDSLLPIRPPRGTSSDGSWTHDLFDRLQNGTLPDKRRGGRGGRGGSGRGGAQPGGRGRGAWNITSAFEQYTNERDGFVVPDRQPNMSAEGMPTTQNVEVPVAPEVSAHNAAAVAEQAAVHQQIMGDFSE